MSSRISIRAFVVLVAAIPLVLSWIGAAVHVAGLRDVAARSVEVREELEDEVRPLSGAAALVDSLQHEAAEAALGGLDAGERLGLIGLADEAIRSIEGFTARGELTEEGEGIETALVVLGGAEEAWSTASFATIDEQLDEAHDALRDVERIAIADAAAEAATAAAEAERSIDVGVALAALGASGLVVAAVALVSVVGRPLRALTERIHRGEASGDDYRSVSSRLAEVAELSAALGDLSDAVARGRVELERQASTDPLTGLANRAAFNEQLGVRDAGALLLVDLDDFKAVNDSHGHLDGDAVLVEVARRLQQAAGPDDLVARLGGDEFAVIVDGDPSRAAELAAVIVGRLARPIDLGDRVHVIGASVGWAEQGAGRSDLVHRADMALYAAKESSADAALAFAPWMADRARQRELREGELRAALSAAQIRVALDPVVALDTRAVEGYEALVRWEHPVHGSLDAAAFVGEMERYGLAEELFVAALEQVAEAMASGSHGDGTWIGVNVSPDLVESARTIASMEAHLRRLGIDHHRIVLEIPGPTLAAAPDEVLAELRRIRGSGVRITADQVGAGDALLPSLHRLPLDLVKLAPVMFHGLLSDRRRVVAIAAVVDIVRAYGLQLIATGVDQLEVRSALVDRGVAMGQGQALGEPVVAALR